MFNRFFNTALSAVIAVGVLSSGGLVWAAEPVKTEAEYQAELKQLDAKLLAKPDDPGALYRHALIMGRLGQFQSEVIESTKLVAKYPTWRDAFLLLANGQSGLHHSTEALAALDKAFALGPPTNAQNIMKARLLRANKKYAESIAIASQVIKLDPNDANAFDSRAASYYCLFGACELGVRDLEQVVRISPNDTVAKSLIVNLRKEISFKSKAKS